jgi:formate hydrogenlyase subunit 6/NADH:ubiquinone oxidoreductase subunit I
MSVTFRHLFRRPVTIMYPHETLKKPQSKDYYPGKRKLAKVYEKGTFGVEGIWGNYRGAIGLDVDACISCGICARICPDKCITYVEFPGRDKNKKVPQVDFGLCMFCGLCEEHCPKSCIFLTTEYDLADFKKGDLVYGPERLAKFKEFRSDKRFPERSKELPSWEMSKCIGCQLCARRCPTLAITMLEADKFLEKHGMKWDDGKKKPKSLPDFDKSKCVSCGTCAEVCPKDTISMDIIDTPKEGSKVD